MSLTHKKKDPPVDCRGLPFGGRGPPFGDGLIIQYWKKMGENRETKKLGVKLGNKVGEGTG